MFSKSRDPTTPGTRAPPRHTYGRRSANRAGAVRKPPSPGGSDADTGTDGTDGTDGDGDVVMGTSKSATRNGRATSGSQQPRDAKRARLVGSPPPHASLTTSASASASASGSPSASTSASSRSGLLAAKQSSLASGSGSHADAKGAHQQLRRSNTGPGSMAAPAAPSGSASGPGVVSSSSSSGSARAAVGGAGTSTKIEVALHPPSSSPPGHSPAPARGKDGRVTPLRRSPRGSPAPPASPKDLSALFAPIISPGPSKLGPSGSASSVTGSGAGESQGSTSSSASAPAPRRAPRGRMLSKAASMQVTAAPAAPSPPSTPRALRLSQSMPITPGSAMSEKSQQNDSPAAGSPSMAAAAGAALVAPIPGSPGSGGGRSRRTYGHSRSFLSAAEVDMDEAPRESYAERRKQFETDNDDEDGATRNLYAELQLASAPERISDMRSKGENRRFMDEITSILDGLDGGNRQAIRRGAALDILDNMRKDGWIAKMEVVGRTDEVLSALTGTSDEGTPSSRDEVLDAAALLFLGQLAVNGALNSVLHNEPGNVIELLCQHLSVQAGPLDRAAYRGKATPAILKLRQIASDLYPDTDDETSTRRVASMVLGRSVRESLWHLVEQDIASQPVGRVAAESLTAEIRPLRHRLELYAKGLDLIPADAAVDLVHLQQVLELLGSLVAFSTEERDRMTSAEDGQVNDMMDVLVVMSAATLHEDKDTQLQAAQTVVLALQLLTPLISSQSLKDLLLRAACQPGTVTALARSLVNRDVLASSLRRRPDANDGSSEAADDATDGGGENDDEAEGGESSSSAGTTSPDDVLSLVLAVLGSMVMAGSDAAAAIAMTPVPVCGKRSCAIVCKCSTARSAAPALATTLAELYSTLTSRADEPFAAYLHGYVAFLLASLLSAAPATRYLVEDLLPGDGWRSKLQGLKSVLHELSSVNAIAHRKLRALVEVEGGDDGEANTPGADDGVLKGGIEELERLIAEEQ